MRASERRKRRRSVRCHFGRVRLTTPARSPLPPPTRELAPTSSASSGVLVPTRIHIRQKSNQPASLSSSLSLYLTLLYPLCFCPSLVPSSCMGTSCESFSLFIRYFTMHIICIWTMSSSIIDVVAASPSTTEKYSFSSLYSTTVDQ